LADGGPPAERALATARAALQAGDVEATLAGLLEAVALDKAFRGGLARKALLACFVMVGEEHEMLDDYRRRLATLLY
jgi:putative thioredoxin